jgi:hypothetical protein
MLTLYLSNRAFKSASAIGLTSCCCTLSVTIFLIVSFTSSSYFIEGAGGVDGATDGAAARNRLENASCCVCCLSWGAPGEEVMVVAKARIAVEVVVNPPFRLTLRSACLRRIVRRELFMMDDVVRIVSVRKGCAFGQSRETVEEDGTPRVGEVRNKVCAN